MKEFPGQFDRRSLIASAGATAVALALPVLPAETLSTKGHIIVNPSGADDAPGSLAKPSYGLFGNGCGTIPTPSLTAMIRSTGRLVSLSTCPLGQVMISDSILDLFPKP